MFIKKYLIEPQVQMKILSYALIVHVLTFTVIYIFFSKIIFDQYFLFQVQLSSSSLHCNPDEMLFMIDPSKAQSFHLFYFGAFFFTLIVLFMILCVVTNRIIGPIYRLKKALRDQNCEALQQMSFREHDYFKELAHLVQKNFKNINSIK